MPVKKYTGPERRREQAKFTPTDYLPIKDVRTIMRNQRPQSHLLHKQHGGFMATIRGTVNAKAVLKFSLAGKPVEIKLRQGDKNKQVEIYQYQWRLVVVDNKGNVIKEIERESLPKVKDFWDKKK